MMRRFVAHPALALGSTLLWGVIELLALWRSRWSNSGRPGRGEPPCAACGLQAVTRDRKEQ
jgi:hypothetical protein